MSAPFSATPRIVVAGNPNAGKTSIFNLLTGLNLKVGNYPGVTVDRHSGKVNLSGGQALIEDLPGTYSLSARSAEEEIAMSSLAGHPPYVMPDLVLLVIDGTQLARNLYLVLQVLELGIPCVCAISMADQVELAGDSLDIEALSAALGVTVVPTAARTGQGLEQLKAALSDALKERRRPPVPPGLPPYGGELGHSLERIGAQVPDDWHHGDARRRAALARWALLSLDPTDELSGLPDSLRTTVNEERDRLESAGEDADLMLIGPRYAWIDEHVGEFLHSKPAAPAKRSWSERFDRVLLHPLLGLPIFLIVMAALFQSLFAWADPMIGGVEGIFGQFATFVRGHMQEGYLREFVTEGLIAGVGAVVVFLPQILLLFLFLGVLESSGYMARVAWLMDRLMRSMGLTGRAFVPMLSGYACAIPAIMATRTMERKRDRLKTMLVVPLMTCSARLPVYTLIIATLFPTESWFGLSTASLLMVGMYLFGTVIALLAAAVLSRTVLSGPAVPLVLELPAYRRPEPIRIIQEAWLKGRAFLSEAGTIILVSTIVLWVLLSFPQRDSMPNESPAEAHAIQLESSYAGQIGHFIEPTLAPLGFEWRIAVGLIGAFAAREVFISTLGIVHGVGDEADEESTSLRQRLRDAKRTDGTPLYTPLVGLSLLVFFALACQCLSTLAVVRRETATWRWPAFLLAYMTVLSWVASAVVYQTGLALGFT